MVLKTGLQVDVAPFVESLRTLYQEEFTTSVARAVVLYQDQIKMLDVVWPKETTTAEGSSSFLIDDDLP